MPSDGLRGPPSQGKTEREWTFQRPFSRAHLRNGPYAFGSQRWALPGTHPASAPCLHDLRPEQGEYAGKSYSTTFVNRTVWKPRDLYNLFGDKAFDMMTPVGKGKIGKDNLKVYSRELEEISTITSGGERLNSRKTG